MVAIELAAKLAEAERNGNELEIQSVTEAIRNMVKKGQITQDAAVSWIARLPLLHCHPILAKTKKTLTRY